MSALTSYIGLVCGKIIDLIVRALALSRIHPNVLTFLGLLINIWAAFLFAAGRFQARSPDSRIGERFPAPCSYDPSCHHQGGWGARRSDGNDQRSFGNT